MPYDAERHHRRSMRWHGYDYSQVGAYFVTICVANREQTLGEVTTSGTWLSEIGLIVEDQLLEVAERFDGVTIDAYIIMPDHVHATFVLTECSTQQVTLGQVIRAMKSGSAIAANRALRRSAQPFWQRGYYDRVLRTERELNLARQYILQNPARWLVRENQL